MKSVVSLWETCLEEAGLQHHVRILEDLAYARSRMEHEGLSFLTITLPNYEKDLLTAISRGWIGSDLFCSFCRKGGLPAFLSGFLLRVFHPSGRVRKSVDVGALRSLRQVLLLVSKVELPTSSRRINAALAGYVSTDSELEEIDEGSLATFRHVSRNLLGPYLAAVESRLYHGDWNPRHSSGAVAGRESYNSRRSCLTWTERLNKVFPWWDDLASGYHEVLDLGDSVTVLARDTEPPVRVGTVPKTMKGPRIIAMEPAWMMFVQQGIFHVMTETLQQARFSQLREIFAWDDQLPNRELAREGSVDGSFATLDLSEASDRVSWQLVQAMLSSTPFLRECVGAARSESALMPNGQMVRLKKFASMGSALCFPIESMVFFIIEAISIADSRGMAPEHLRVRDLPRMRVYGDDLIVPNTGAQALIRRLESFGLKVNARKSFTTGLFRESCGADWFQGCDVSVFKLRHPLPEGGRQYEALDQAIEFHNHAYSAGWFLVAGEVESRLKSVLPRIPRAPVGTRISALWSWDGPFVVGTCPRLHREVRPSVIFRQTKPVDPLSGYGALRKFFEPHVVREKDHLERDGRSRYVGVHIGRVAVPYGDS